MQPDYNNVNELLFRLLDNEINDSDFEKLTNWLNSSREAKLYYYRFMEDCSALSLRKMTTIAEDHQDSQFNIDLGIDSSVALEGVDVQDILSGKKEAAVAGFDDSADRAAMEAMHQLAEREESAAGIEIPKEKPNRELIQKVVYLPHQKHKLSKFQKFQLVACAVGVILFVLFVKFSPEPVPSVAVATVSDQMNVKWAESSYSLETGSRLWTKDFPLDIKEGIVSIEFDEGVEVVIEGPALFEIERSGIYLEYGRMYSRVSQTGLGFTVRTPTSQFVDLGTEFGVLADIDGSSELHVIKGKVQLFAGSNKDTKFSQMVTTGTAVVYNANTHQIKSTPVANHRFVSQIDSKTKSILRGYANRYEQAIAETKPVAYYRFEKGKDALGYDEMSGSVTPCDYSEAVTFAPGPAINSVYGNQSLYLSGDADSGIFLSDKTAIQSGGRALSISLWIQPGPAMDGQQSIIYFTDHEKRIDHVMTNQLYLTPDNRVGFYVYNIFKTQIPIPFTDWEGLSRENTMPFVLETLEPLPDNEWSHVVACFSDQKIELYVNGQLCETKPIPIRTECYQRGYWGIGCLTNARNQTFKTKKLSYKGFIDEVGFYDRKLSAREVRLLYDAAKPLR